MGNAQLVDEDFYVTQATAADRLSTPGGTYYDEVERKAAEDARAKVEDREPDYDTMGGTAGVPIKTARQINGDGHVATVPHFTYPVVKGEPELDENGEPTGNKAYLGGVETESSGNVTVVKKKAPAKKAVAKKAPAKKAVAKKATTAKKK